MRFAGRLPILAAAGAALMLGLWAGLARIGWSIAPLRAADHGPLMIAGFLGTLICLERAAASRRRWAYAAPVVTAAGAAALVAGLPVDVSRALLVAGSMLLIAALIFMYHHHYGWRAAWAGLCLILGAGLWWVGNGLWWARFPLAQVTPWWLGFLVITVAGERLELAALRVLSPASRLLFGGGVGGFVGGLVLARFALAPGLRLSGIGLAAIGIWLLYYDVARRTIWQTGLPRFVAACLLPGYVWLIAAGACWAAWPDFFAGGPYYDAMVHMVALGFVFSMIFGHAPIIFPALLGAAVVYRPIFFGPLVLLHASLVLRVAGDLGATPRLRLWAGLLNAMAILLFIFSMIASTRRQTAAPPGSGR